MSLEFSHTHFKYSDSNSEVKVVMLSTFTRDNYGDLVFTYMRKRATPKSKMK